MKTFVSQPPWEFERHRRGSIRWYPFDALLNNGLASAGSTAVVTAPSLELFSGLLAALGSSKGREAVEKDNFNIWMSNDALDYWSRPHKLTVFTNIGLANASVLGAFTYTALFMQPPGLPPWSTTPAFPYVILRYARNSILDPGGEDERFELIVAPGDGITAQTITRLTGVDPPRSPISPGGSRAQRWEIFYMPDQYVSAAINGVTGATVTTNLPISATVPGINLAGIGVYLEAGQVNTSARSSWHSMMLETYRK